VIDRFIIGREDRYFDFFPKEVETAGEFSKNSFPEIWYL
jgi:hypothetical protein